MESKIVIHDIHVSDTGHVTLWVKTKNVDGNRIWEGPLIGYGVSRQALIDQFHDSLDEYEVYVAKEHAPYVGAHPDIRRDLVSRKGKIIG